MRLVDSKVMLLLMSGYVLVHAPVDAALLEYEGTVAAVSGLEIGVQLGESVVVEVEYNESVGPLFPGFFENAIESMRIMLPDSDIDISGGAGLFLNNITITNDLSMVADRFLLAVDGVSGTTALAGETVTQMQIELSEDLPGPELPGLVTSDTVLPTPPLDLESPGTVAMGVGFGFASFQVSSAVSLDFTPVPEPAGAAALVPSVLLLLGLRFRRKP